MNFKEYPDREMLEMHVADALASALRNCLSMHEKVSFAVPGGTTPGPIFDLLRGTELEWERVNIMLTDERWVPETDSQSNGALVRSRLMADRAAAATFLPFYRDGMTPEDGAAEVAGSLDAELPLSLLVLGMGADMHTASLFPGASGTEAAMASDAAHLCAVSPEGQVARVTLSGPVLKGAMETHVIITGQEKRAAIEKAQGLSPDQAPIATVLGSATVHWAA